MAANLPLVAYYVKCNIPKEKFGKAWKKPPKIRKSLEKAWKKLAKSLEPEAVVSDRKTASPSACPHPALSRGAGEGVSPRNPLARSPGLASLPAALSL
jgi:hypothetical protein